MRLLARGYLLFVLLVTSITFMLSGCSEDDEPAAPNPPARNVASTGSQDYSWIDVELSNFPAGTTLQLRTPHWSTAELTADPQARISAQSATVFRVEFMGLAAGSFVGTSARILVVAVDSVVDELAGIVVLCDETGPIILAPECQGNCAPLCGLPGHDCDG